jgi:hypothetical protein
VHELSQIYINIRVIKTSEYDPEGLYVAFPFNLDGGVWHLDKPGAMIRPGNDQIPGSCCDYYLLQDGAVCKSPNLSIRWTTLDAPLVHIGDMRLWQYNTFIKPHGALYSWVTNNKWDCNFPLDCGGNFEFRYILELESASEDIDLQKEKLRASAKGLITIRCND